MAMAAPGSAEPRPPRGPVPVPIPGSTLSHATPSQSSEPRGDAAARREAGGGGEGGVEDCAQEDTIVWIANPCEGKPPIPVERWRVLERGFEEEALDVLWDARGAY